MNDKNGPRGRWRAVALGGVIGAFAACAPAIPAMAASPAAPAPAASTAPASTAACNAVVIDSTAEHVLQSDSAVTQAAARLEAKGADVRIRVLAAAPGGSLDAYEAAQVAACPSWSLQGQIKPNLVVFLVSLDHQDGVFYGANYSRLQGHVDQIRADMGGDFRSGDFAAGIAQGEQETYSALYPSGMPAWLIIVIVIGIVLVLGFVLAAIGGGSSYGPGRGGYAYIPTGGGWGGGGGGGVSSGGGTSGGSSGSW